MYTELQALTTAEDHIECIFVKIMYNGITFIVGTVYRPPNCIIIDFNDAMSDILEKKSAVILVSYLVTST